MTKTNWFYFDEVGKRVAVTGGQLKWLARQGIISPETVVENEAGKSALAKNVKGLIFPGLVAAAAVGLMTAPIPAVDHPPHVPMPETGGPSWGGDLIQNGIEKVVTGIANDTGTTDNNQAITYDSGFDLSESVPMDGGQGILPDSVGFDGNVLANMEGEGDIASGIFEFISGFFE